MSSLEIFLRLGRYTQQTIYREGRNPEDSKPVEVIYPQEGKKQESKGWVLGDKLVRRIPALSKTGHLPPKTLPVFQKGAPMGHQHSQQPEAKLFFGDMTL